MLGGVDNKGGLTRAAGEDVGSYALSSSFATAKPTAKTTAKPTTTAKATAKPTSTSTSTATAKAIFRHMPNTLLELHQLQYLYD